MKKLYVTFEGGAEVRFAGKLTRGTGINTGLYHGLLDDGTSLLFVPSKVKGMRLV